MPEGQMRILILKIKQQSSPYPLLASISGSRYLKKLESEASISGSRYLKKLESERKERNKYQIPNTMYQYSVKNNSEALLTLYSF